MQLNIRDIKRNMHQVLGMILILSGAFMCYKALSLIANTSTPVVVVLSGSMEPAFQRGDILFMWNRQSRVNVGDIVVYDTKVRSIPIVHRVLRQHSSSRKQLVLTKGDNNPLDDLDLYAYKQMYLDRAKDITGGVVKAYFPKLGYATILLTENPTLRTVVIGISLLSQLLSNE